MGVVSFGEKNEDWTAGNWVVRAILDYAIEKLGERDYLLKYCQEFDHGYNAIDIGDISYNEIVEFTKVIEAYLETEAYKELLSGEGYDSEFYGHLSDLVRKLEMYAKTRHGPDIPNA